MSNLEETTSYNLPSFEDHLKIIAEEVLKAMGFIAAINVFANDKDPSLKVLAINSEEDLSMLIGKNGQNLTALEHVLRLLVLRRSSVPGSFMLDVNDYRQSKAQAIIRQAVEVAGRVRASKKAEALAPMSAYERRLIHVELASSPDVETESIGEEPQRRIVIRPLTI